MAEELQSMSYDVFLSFRGLDTRYTFIKDVRDKLKRKGIRIFVDDDMLKLGDVISPSLDKAIKDSAVLIVVLSENYASSTWCLKELVKIMQCLSNRQQLVFPIFYHVEPSHVQHLTGKYGKAMVAHENRGDIKPDEVRQWRSALKEVSQLVGPHISPWWKWKTFVDKIILRKEINIVEEIVKKVKIVSKPFHGKDPVGFKQRIEEVKSLLDMNLDDDEDDDDKDNNTVCMLGIYGPRGIGKTEFAKALYGKIRHKFKAESFIANVREKSMEANGMEELQKTLMSNMCEKLETVLDSKSRGIEIQSRLGKKKIILVLDDVDHIDQLNNLAGGCDWFGPGSRVIITTRDEDLLHHHGVQNTYKMVELDDQQSLELFCQNAFGQSHPKKSYEDLCSRAVTYAKGLPSDLKALGWDLATEDDLEYWECTLEEYKTNRNPRI